MKITVTFLFLLFWITSFGQNNNLINQLQAPRKITDCEVITLNAVDKLYGYMRTNKFDSVDYILNEWVKLCGTSEIVQRISILTTILRNQTALELVKKYIQSDYHYTQRARILNSRKDNFGYIYTGEKYYFGYVPLRHPIDSVIMYKSEEILRSKTLTPDEKLICTLFSGNLEEFDRLMKEPEYKDTFIKNYFKNRIQTYHNSWLGYIVYSGVYTPIGVNRVFNNSPYLGMTMSTPLRYKLVVELGFKFRININDQSFQYYALGTTNTVNSGASFFLGTIVGYKIFESKNLIITPKVGIGLESVSTGLYEKKDNNNNDVYYSVETMHLSAGISFMKPIFRKNYYGIEFTYHYCPYGWDKNLLTPFNNSSFSGELFFRF